MKLSRQTREIINIVLFFLIVGLALTFYMIYPLNRAKALMGRPDADSVVLDSLPPNDPGLYAESDLTIDTFRIESDGLTSLACILVAPILDSGAVANGTVVILPGEGSSRDSLVPLVTELAGRGLEVMVYDQRANGVSSGQYRGDGQYEAEDLQSVIASLAIRDQLALPITAIGTGLGAEAALLAAQVENRIGAVIAINPYLSTTAYIDQLREQHGTIWFPFTRSILWWWYDIRSGYAAEYRDIDEIQGVTCRTLIALPTDRMDSEGVALLTERSEPGLLTLVTMPDSPERLSETILEFLMLPQQSNE